ncbi:MAG: site-2 protease family protein [bacterium]|nr:site-2 protease family protein [bacterium]
MTVVIAIIIGILLLGFLVFVHEAGHFFTAKLFGVKVEEFGFGFPPRLWGKKRGETIYSINAIPAGGFVRLFGEDGEHERQQRSFSSKGPWRRSLIIAAGACINLIIAFLIFTVLLGMGGFRSYFPSRLSADQSVNLSLPFGVREQSILIAQVSKESPAQMAGLRSLDDVVSANGQRFQSVQAFQNFVKERGGQQITLKVKNIVDLGYRTVTVTPRQNPPKNQGALGVLLNPEFGRDIVTIEYQKPIEKVFSGPLHSVNMLYFQGQALGALVSQSFREGTPEPVAKNVSGPVGIISVLGLIVSESGLAILPILQVVALISLILGVINLLPIPAVDGGRLFFTVFEGLTGKRVNPNIERIIHTAGFAFLIVLFVIFTFNDISRFFS